MSGFGRKADGIARSAFTRPPASSSVAAPSRRCGGAFLADYEHRNRLATPVIRRVLSQLAGGTYDGSALLTCGRRSRTPPRSGTDTPAAGPSG